MQPPERWLHGSRPARVTEPTSRQNRLSTCPSAPGGRAPGPGATDGVRAAHARPPRRSSGCLGLDLGCPRRLLPAACQVAAQRAASRCCCWRPLTSARRPATVVGGIVANFEHLWGREGARKSRSRAHWVPVSVRDRQGPIPAGGSPGPATQGAAESLGDRAGSRWRRPARTSRTPACPRRRGDHEGVLIRRLATRESRVIACRVRRKRRQEGREGREGRGAAEHATRVGWRRSKGGKGLSYLSSTSPKRKSDLVRRIEGAARAEVTCQWRATR